MKVDDFIRKLRDREAPDNYPTRKLDDLVIVDDETGSLCYVGGIIWNDNVAAFQIVPGEPV